MNNCSYDKILHRGAEMDNPTCSCFLLHEDIVRKLKRLCPDENKLMDLADLFKIFGDSTGNKDTLLAVGK